MVDFRTKLFWPHQKTPSDFYPTVSIFNIFCSVFFFASGEEKVVATILFLLEIYHIYDMKIDEVN